MYFGQTYTNQGVVPVQIENGYLQEFIAHTHVYHERKLRCRSEGPVKLMQWVKIAHLFLQSVSNQFHFIILNKM